MLIYLKIFKVMYMFYTNSKSYIFQNPKNNQEANAVHVNQVPFVASISMSVDHPVLPNRCIID